MILELTGDAPVDGPVAGIVDSRRHLVRNQSAFHDEEFDGQNADVSQAFHEFLQASPRRPLQGPVDEGSHAVAQDAAGVGVRGQGVVDDLARRRARANDGDFAGEPLELFVDEPGCADVRPGGIDIFRMPIPDGTPLPFTEPAVR